MIKIMSFVIRKTTLIFSLLSLMAVDIAHPAMADAVPLEFAVGIPPGSDPDAKQYLYHEVVSLRSGPILNNYLAFNYLRFEPFEKSSTPYLTQLFKISGNKFVPVVDEVEAQRVLSDGLKVDLFEKDVASPGRARSLSQPDYLIEKTECNFLSNRLKLSGNGTKDNPPWYLLRLSSQSQFSDGVATWPCKNLEGRIVAWTKVAALEPAAYSINNSYLLVDTSSPVAFFADGSELKCLIQHMKNTRNEQLVLHLFSNEVLPAVFNSSLLTEADIDVFRSVITREFETLFSKLTEARSCVFFDTELWETARLFPDRRTYAFPPPIKGSPYPPPQ